VRGSRFLPDVPEAYVLDRLALAGGNEIQSGKFDSPESSAALAANAFGWFVPRPELLPPIPGVESAGRALKVELEYNARFPWQGGMHPWLDAAIFTKTHLIGVESKRYEPFRDAKTTSFSDAYDQPVWGEAMTRYTRVRRDLQSAALAYRHLDAAQLVKHAYGLVTEGRRLELRPVLFYLYAEPAARGGRAISDGDHTRHRDEISDFGARVAGDEVRFGAASYGELFSDVTGDVVEHRDAVVRLFEL
jgi:hypothetical protein